MPRAKRSPAEDRGDAMAIIERLHRAGWSIGDVPLRGERGGCAKTDGSCWSKSERGRGAGAALAKKGRARYCLTPMGACSPWGGQGSRGPVCRPQRVRDDPHPTGPRPRPSPRPGPPC